MAKDGGYGLVLFLDRNRLYLAYGEKIIYVDIPTTAIQDLDVVDREGLRGLVGALIDKNKISPANVILVLSQGVCFIKNLEEKEETKIETEFKNFYNLVPFNSVVARMYQTKEGLYGIAANGEVVEIFSEIFEGKGFKIAAAIPVPILGQEGAKKELDLSMVKYVNSNFDFLKSQSLVNREGEVPEREEIGQKKPWLPKNLFLLLLPILAVLITILIFMILKTY